MTAREYCKANNLNSLSDLSRRVKVSRKTLYKWWEIRRDVFILIVSGLKYEKEYPREWVERRSNGGV